jgi:hypothetical protein
MTNKKSLCFKSQNVPTGVSDCHNIISTVIKDKGEVLHEPKKLRYYRSYKTFDIENFNDDIEQIKINQTCHEVDSVYALLSELSMSKFRSPNNNICS